MVTILVPPKTISATIEIAIHDSAKNTNIFKKAVDLKITKPEIFKYGIFMWEVPKHIKESDFAYLQSKIPHLEALLNDHIDITKDSIVNLSGDDRVKKMVSETVGIAIGLRYSIKLLNTKIHKFKKIPPATEGKYLDYSVVEAGKLYEIETKGTISPFPNSMITDILAKKANASTQAYLRYGTIAQLKSDAAENRISRCLIVDDPPEETNSDEQEPDVRDTILANYGVFLSYILDSKYYNRFIRPVLDKRRVSKQIETKKFYCSYQYNGKEFLGECFDYRLIERNIRLAASTGSKQVREVFKRVTDKIGRTKFFLGLEKRLVEAINKGDYHFINNYNNEIVVDEQDGSYEFLDADGILVVKSRGGANQQLERIFPEEEVESRVRLYANYVDREAHRCGAPCRSPQKVGDLCQKLTYRVHCYFHR
jgi:hypothetical protein